jgi:AraC family transcriptional regulator
VQTEQLSEGISIAVEAEACLPVAVAQLVRCSIACPTNYVRAEQDTYRLDLVLTPRASNASACYVDRWRPHRFEKIGDLFVVPPGESMQARSDPIAMQRSVICYLRPEQMQEWFQTDLRWSDRRLQAGLDIHEPNIRYLLRRVACELESPGLATNVALGLLMAQITLEIGRYCADVEEGPPRGGLAPWRLRLIEERLAECRAAPSLPELAQLCSLSIRALTRGFRINKGVSIGDYVAARQLAHAKALWLEGRSIKSVAYSLGFASSASFCYAFRRLAGEAPGQYRDRALRDKRLPS